MPSQTLQHNAKKLLLGSTLGVKSCCVPASSAVSTPTLPNKAAIHFPFWMMFYNSTVPTQHLEVPQQTNAAISLLWAQNINDGIQFVAKANFFIWLGADSS